MPNLSLLQTQSLAPQLDVSGGNGGPGTNAVVGGLLSVGSQVATIYEQHERELGILQATDALSTMQRNLQYNRENADTLPGDAIKDLNESDDPIAGIDAYTEARAQRAKILSPKDVGDTIDKMASQMEGNINGPGRGYFRQRVAEMRGQAVSQADSQQHAEYQGVLSAGIDGATSTAAQVTAQDHNQYPQQLAQLTAAIETTSLPPDVKAQKTRQATSTLSSAATDGLVTRYPAAALAGLNRYFGIAAPAAAPPQEQPASPNADAPMPDGITADTSPAAAAQRDANDISALNRELARPGVTSEQRQILQGELDKAMKQAPPAPTTTTLTADAAAQALIDRGGKPGDASLSFLNALMPIQALEFRNRALEAVQRGQATQRTALEAQTKDYQAMVLAGVVPPPASTPTAAGYATAYGAGGAQRYEAEVGMYARLASGLAQLQSASFADRQAVIGRFAPVPGEGFDEQQRIQGTLAQANQLMEKKLAADPAAYAAQTSPKVQQAAAAMQAAPGNVVAADAYALATIAEQERLGIRQVKGDVLGEGGVARQLAPRLLTNGQANAISAQFHTSGANAAELMSGLQAQWGTHFPAVYAQLAQDDKLPPAALVIPNMSDPYAKETLARYSDPKLQKDMIENLPAGATKDINTALQQANEPFFNSLAFQQGGQRTYDTVLEQQRTLAGAYVMQGRSAADAARIAYQQTVGHQYVFSDSLRIPKAEQPDLVQSGLGTLQMAPETLHASPPASYRPGLTPKARNDAWLDAIKSNATWVANGDESGATLVVRGRTDTGADVRYPVPGPDGKTPMSWSWAQLRAIGMQRKAQARTIIETGEPPVSTSAGGF